MELNVSTDDYPPSSVKGQDGNTYEICPLETMLDALDTAADCIMTKNAESALYVLAELKLRLLADAALYERIISQGMRGHEYVRQ